MRGFGTTGMIKRSRSRPPSIYPTDSAENSGEEQTRQYVAWFSEKGTYRPAGETIPSVPAGIYSIKVDSNGWFLEPTNFNSDELLNLPGLPIEFILGQIDTFWKKAERFKKIGLLHKRGILLYGAAGCGKTSIIKLLCNNIVAHNGIVLLIQETELASTALQGIRQIEPDRPLLTIIEDIDVYMDDEMGKRGLLTFLDGETQVNHIVHLATTNYPDRLDETITKRPGRFDVVIELKQPVREAREAYLKSLLGDEITSEQLEKLVDATAGLGLSHLRELVSATHCLDLDLTDTLDRLKGNIRAKLKAPKVGGEEGLGYSIGFGTHNSKPHTDE